MAEHVYSAEAQAWRPSPKLVDESALHMQKPRKAVNASFVAEWPSTCNACHGEIKKGDRARYNPEGLIVHHRHEVVEKPVEVCQTCWLTKPCECD